MEGYTEGTCLACKRPCTTCEGSPTYCTSCAAGYSRKSMRCRNNTYVGFRFTIASSPSEILASIDTIIAGMLSIMSMNSTQLEAITFESITSGSSILNGALTNDASTQSVTALSSTLSAGLASGIPGTPFAVSSVSVTANDPYATTTEESSSKVGLIVGVVVGVTVLGIF